MGVPAAQWLSEMLPKAWLNEAGCNAYDRAPAAAGCFAERRADGVDAVDPLERSAIERAPSLLGAAPRRHAGCRMPPTPDPARLHPLSSAQARAIVASSSRSSRWCPALGCSGTGPDRLHAVIRATAGLRSGCWSTPGRCRRKRPPLRRSSRRRTRSSGIASPRRTSKRSCQPRAASRYPGGAGRPLNGPRTLLVIQPP